MPDFTQFFNPSAWGSWNQPNQSMAPKPPVAPAMGGFGASSPGAAQPGVMQAQPGGGGGNPLSMLFGGMGGGGGGMFGGLMDKFGASPIGQKLESALRSQGGTMGAPMNITPNAAGGGGGGGIMGGISGNPMLAKFGGALMGGQNPLQAMMSNPGDFAKWMAQRRTGMLGQPPQATAGPAQFTPQPPVPTQQPGMLGGLM